MLAASHNLTDRKSSYSPKIAEEVHPNSVPLLSYSPQVLNSLETVIFSCSFLSSSLANAIEFFFLFMLLDIDNPKCILFLIFALFFFLFCE